MFSHFNFSSMCFSLYFFGVCLRFSYILLHLLYKNCTLSSDIVNKRFKKAKKTKGRERKRNWGWDVLVRPHTLFVARIIANLLDSKWLFLHTPLHLRLCKVCGWHEIFFSHFELLEITFTQ